MELTVHYVTDLVAILVGTQLYIHSKIFDTVSDSKRTYLLIGALVGALVGSRLIAGLEDPTLFLHPPNLLYYYENKTIIGGIAGGILGFEVVKKIMGITVWTGDRTLVPLAIAIIIGRIGCFVAGVQDGTVGEPCNYFWCIEQGDGLLRHPNSLYEIGFVVMFLIGLYFLRKTTNNFFIPIIRTPGATFRLFIVLYFSMRFGIEFLKETHPLFLNLNSIQLTCLVFILWYLRDLTRIYVTRKI